MRRMISENQSMSLRFFSVWFLTGIFTVLLTFSSACAVDYYQWFGGTGSWEDPLNWNPNGIPGTSNDADGTTVDLTNASSSSATAYFSGVGLPYQHSHTSKLNIYGTGENTMTLEISGGRISVGFLDSFGLDIGDKGVIEQTGGRLTFNRWSIVRQGGTYNLKGGVLGSGIGDYGLYVAGVFNQTGGDIDYLLDLNVSGVYNLSAGSLHSGGTRVMASVSVEFSIRMEASGVLHGACLWQAHTI